jgi:hypothetical protein
MLARFGVSESLVPRTVQSLRLLELIEDDGNPTDALRTMAKAGSDELQERVAAHLRSVYSDVFALIDGAPASATPEALEKAFRSYTPAGQLARMVGLFVGLCEYAGLMPPGKASSNGASTRPRPVRPRPTRVRTQQDRGSGNAGGKGDETPEPAPASEHPAIKAFVNSLPVPGSEFPDENREEAIEYIRASFNLMYKRSRRKELTP